MTSPGGGHREHRQTHTYTATQYTWHCPGCLRWQLWELHATSRGKHRRPPGTPSRPAGACFKRLVRPSAAQPAAPAVLKWRSVVVRRKTGSGSYARQGPSPRPDRLGRHLLRARRHRPRSCRGGAPLPGVGPHAAPLAHWGATWVGFSAWRAHPPLSPSRPSAECRSRGLSRRLPLPDTSFWFTSQGALTSQRRRLCRQSTTRRRQGMWPASRVLWTQAPT